jgi:hypothetical protein
MKRRPATDETVRFFNGPGNNGSSIRNCANWTDDMRLRLDEPSGESLSTDDIRRTLGILRA